MEYNSTSMHCTAWEMLCVGGIDYINMSYRFSCTQIYKPKRTHTRQAFRQCVQIPVRTRWHTPCTRNGVCVVRFHTAASHCFEPDQIGISAMYVCVCVCVRECVWQLRVVLHQLYARTLCFVFFLFLSLSPLSSIHISRCIRNSFRLDDSFVSCQSYLMYFGLSFFHYIFVFASILWFSQYSWRKIVWFHFVDNFSKRNAYFAKLFSNFFSHG